MKTITVEYECEECLGTGTVEVYFQDVTCVCCNGTGILERQIKVNKDLIIKVLELIKG